MVAVMQVDELPLDVPGAEALLLSHSEHKAELDAREASFASFMKQGETLTAANHYASREVSWSKCLYNTMYFNSCCIVGTRAS